jgi:hypothetical protein
LTGRWAAAVVVSNDGDLARAIRIARSEGRIPVGVVNPHDGRQSRHLAREASFTKTIRRSDLAQSLLPDRLTDANGVIDRPAEW